ncbi:GOLPH3/VPS74 family protein [Saccharopolyspora flava]|uniref:Golgi phosphoprotein 3 (GPP34) n=1 Tax=Saccharopolyspora flava TaxID=95161 RepID=A0A1I6T8S7_9PSEU|nr:GPP34 family phosphoprotein [Saccharopolyspora flava]SFS85629.1 Golgi phosphoprotein 3 (GPP34) [Saccharopolyspora flava]
MTQLSLPEEFVLLLHKPRGFHYVTADHTGAAEMGELVLTERFALTDKKLTVLDPEPTGTAWIDESVEYVQRKAGPRGRPLAATTFIQSRRKAREQHAEALVERGLMRSERRRSLFIPYNHFTPDPGTRDVLAARIRAAARDEIPLDERLAMLAALVHATGLEKHLGLSLIERKRLRDISKGEELGGAVRDVIAQTTAMLAAAAVAGGAAGS